jgi:methionyl aminopeptidase
LKYKKCCLGKEGKSAVRDKDLYYKKYKISLKEAQDIEGVRRAGALVVKTLDMVESHIQPGISTDSINSLVHDYTLAHGATPAPLNYNGFPKSVCVSVNEVICHGIPGERILQEGDIVNVDVTSILGGYFADANKTFCVGRVSAEAEKIVQVAKQALFKGLGQVRPGNRIGDIGWAIQEWAESQGCAVVREMVGHGVGFQFHEPPQVPHFGNKNQGILLVPGMVFTVEPMINLGRRELLILDDNWTAVTKDSSLSAQFEQTIVVTEDGYESLTPYD